MTGDASGKAPMRPRRDRGHQTADEAIGDERGSFRPPFVGSEEALHVVVEV
jgi:hypothetical protein